MWVGLLKGAFFSKLLRVSQPPWLMALTICHLHCCYHADLPRCEHLLPVGLYNLWAFGFCYWFLYRQMFCQITFWHTTLETCGSVDIYKRDKFFIKNTQRYKLFKQLKCHLFSCKLRLNFPEGKGCVQKAAKQYCNQEQLDSSKFPNFTVCKYFCARKM